MIKQEEYNKAKEYALRSLGCREQTEFQIRQKLQQRKYSSEIVDAVITYLKHYRYLDDQRFVEQYISGHCHRWNRSRLQSRLYTLGFRNLNLDDYLEQYEYDETAVLNRDMRTYLRNKNLSNPDTRNKVISHYLQKGYSFSSIQKCLDMSNSYEYRSEE